jgi:hypothetical protein
MLAEDFAGRILPFEAVAAARYPGAAPSGQSDREIRRTDCSDCAGGRRQHCHA